MTSPGTDIIIDHTTVTEITNPAAEVEVITVQVPGIAGPQGPQGTPGPPNVLTIGSVSNSAPGDPADASITGSAPNQTLNLTLPQGIQGPQGDAGPPPTLSIGTVTTGAAGTGASVSLDSSAAPAYVLSFTIPQGANGGGVAVGGATGDVLMKNSATDFDTKWSTPTSAATASALMERDASGRAQVADPSASADIATKNYVDVTAGTSLPTASALVRRDASGQAQFTKIFNSTALTSTDTGTILTRKDYVDAIPVTTQTGTTYTVALTDQRTAVRMNNAGAMTVTIPPNSSVAFQTGTWIELERQGAGTLTLAPGAGVTFIAPDSSLTARTVGSRVRIHKVGTDTWVVSGDSTSATDSSVSAATSVSTASTLMKRDSNGRASVADPSASTDISTKNYTDTQDAAMRRPQLNTQTVSYTLALTDERKLVQMNSASATTLTVPLNSSVAFAVGTIVELQMLGTGNVTIAPTAGVTLNSTLPSLVMTRQYAVVLLQKTGTDTWNVDRISNASATSASTASTLILRDAAGRASVVDPSASTDISTKNYADTQDLTMRRPTVSTQTASYTIVLTDERKLLQMNSASTTTVTIPTNATTAFPIGTVIDVQQLGAGAVNFTPSGAVTLNGVNSTLGMTRQSTTVRLLKYGTDAWSIVNLSQANATSANTANLLVLRDASARAQFADPSAAQDAATKNYVDTRTPKISIGTTAPSSPATNDVWIDTN